jgi:hypothetical protein
MAAAGLERRLADMAVLHVASVVEAAGGWRLNGATFTPPKRTEPPPYLRGRAEVE